MLLTTTEKEATPRIFVSTRNRQGETSPASELLSAADAIMLAPIIETLPAIEVVSLRGNLDITGTTGPLHARQHGHEMAGWNALCESWTDPSVLPELKKLDLSKCGLNNFALEKLAPVLSRMDRRTGTVVHLEELALSDNDAVTGKELDARAVGNAGSKTSRNSRQNILDPGWQHHGMENYAEGAHILKTSSAVRRQL